MEIMESMLAENSTNQEDSYVHAWFEWHWNTLENDNRLRWTKKENYRLSPDCCLYKALPDCCHFCAFTALLGLHPSLIGLHPTTGLSPHCSAFTQLLNSLLIIQLFSNC